MSTGTVPSTGPAFRSSTIADALSADGTYALSGFAYGGSGILVAIPEYAAAYDVSEFDAAQIHLLIRLWVEDNAAAILSHPAPFYFPRYFGSWVDNGTLYLDIVEAFPRENLSEAIAAGIARDQIAIWDNGRNQFLATNGTGAVD